MIVSKRTRILSAVMSVFVAFGLLVTFTPKAEAASNPLKAVQYDTMYTGSTTMGYLSFEPAGDDYSIGDKCKLVSINKCKLVSIKSSNTKVVRAKKTGSSVFDHYLEPLKTGKSVVTMKYKYKNKTYTLKKTVYVKAYPDAISSITVNGKKVQLTKKAFRFDYDVQKYKKNSAKIVVKPAKGWNLAYSYIIKSNGKKDLSADLKASVFKKGTSIKIPKGYNGYVFISLQCTSGKNKGDTFNYAVRFYRKSF